MDTDKISIKGRWVTPRAHAGKAKQHFFTEGAIAQYMIDRETIMKFHPKAVVRPICRHKITRIHFNGTSEPVGDHVCTACMDAYEKLTSVKL